MAIVPINPQRISGTFASGFALDLHTTSSTAIGEDEHGHMRFDTVRPEVAELLYQLKYHRDKNAAKSIIETAASFLRQHRDKFDLIVPVPPSAARLLQPVLVLANGIGDALKLPVISCVSTTRPSAQLKNVTDPDERKQLLEGLYKVDHKATQDKRILLFDDLFRSGSTMNAVTEILLSAGAAKSVHAFTITRTRSNQ